MNANVRKRKTRLIGWVFRVMRIFLLIAVVGLLVGCKAKPAPDIPSQLWLDWAYDGSYTLTMEPERVLMDTPVTIIAKGLKVGQPVIIRARMQLKNTIYESFAAYAADESGVVDVNQAAPSTGSYSGVDGMGLFWSMKYVESVTDSNQESAPGGLQPMKVTLTLEARDRILASLETERLFYDETKVERRDASQPGMVAALFLPKEPGPHAGIVWLGGSEGGLTEAFPALLASHGYATLALAYFKAGDLPAELVHVPLESAKQGIDWFRAQPEVDEDAIALLGASKGAELALLLAATYPEEIQAVVAYKPSSVVWLGLPSNMADTFRGPRSSWTLDGQPLPFVNGTFTSEMLKLMVGKPAAMVSSYTGGLKNNEAVEAARIPVEKICGPVLLLSGTDDQLWPSTQMAADVVARLDESGFPYRHEHWAYKDCGHGLGLPYSPTTGINQGTLLLGGTPEGTATANADAWVKVLGFLAREFPPRQ